MQDVETDAERMDDSPNELKPPKVIDEKMTIREVIQLLSVESWVKLLGGVAVLMGASFGAGAKWDDFERRATIEEGRSASQVVDGLDNWLNQVRELNQEQQTNFMIEAEKFVGDPSVAHFVALQREASRVDDIVDSLREDLQDSPRWLRNHQSMITLMKRLDARTSILQEIVRAPESDAANPVWIERVQELLEDYGVTAELLSGDFEALSCEVLLNAPD